MKNRLYSIRDRKSGNYGVPFASFNDDTAERDFNAFCRMPQNTYLADDVELYYIGTFDSATGEACDIPDKPVFICIAGVKPNV